MELNIGDKVLVTIFKKNGYWDDLIKGIVLDIKPDKVKVETWQKGKRWYKKTNVSLRKDVNGNNESK